jgi:DNA invertase Pin-like site-specific DNA recombinase
VSVRLCTVRDCGKPHRAKGLCHGHYVRQRGKHDARGTLRELHRLTDAEVVELRETYKGGGISMRELAEEYGVAKCTVWHIVNRLRRADA